MKTKRKIIICGSILVVLAFGNFLSFHLGVYTYESSDHGFANLEDLMKDRGLDTVEGQFLEYQQAFSKYGVTLKRTCERNWLNPFLLVDNIFNRRWKIEFMDPSAKPKYDYFWDLPGYKNLGKTAESK